LSGTEIAESRLQPTAREALARAARRLAGSFAERHARRGKWLGRLVLLAMLTYLAWRLQRIGWAPIWAARPKSAAFYLLLLLSYLALPVADTLIYSHLWKIGFWRSLPAFLRKRIYNAAFIGYSGEVFLLVWARRRVALGDRALVHMIKDTNILSAAVSTLATAALLLYVVGRLPAGTLHAAQWRAGAGITIAMAAIVPFAWIHRDKFMLFGAGTAAAVFAAHLARFLVIQLLQLCLWTLLLPHAPLNALAALLAIQMLIGRIPFLPSRDVLFVGAGIGLAGPLGLPPAAIASLLVTASLFQQAMHLAVFLATSFLGETVRS
jgi:hypothetical protein